MQIHIAVAFDHNYFNQFCALLASVQHHHRKGSVFFHIITTGVLKNKIDSITSYIQKFENEIEYYSVEDDRLNQLVITGTWTSAVYYRLFFPLLVKSNVNRLIYLDCDTLVLKSLQEMFITPLDEHPIAAVDDIYVGTQPLIGIVEKGEYFNSGVILIDVPLWRKQNISERVIDYLQRYPERIRFVDQCGLNAVLHHNWKKLSENYNLIYSRVPESLGIKQLLTFIRDKTIVHFTLERPWEMLCRNRLRYLYYHYLKLSPAESKKYYTDFSFKKIPAWLRIRLMEFYFDSSFLQKTWRTIKRQ